MPIRVLAPEVIAKIAAGEVVERPASVVKELVENSLDAGARSIQVEILAGGCDLIRVADDGRGIPPDELLLAVQRHATSKIDSAADLGMVSTLGFRGEALASIAAVSEIVVLSRQGSVSAATELRMLGGESPAIGSGARAPGTTVTVEKLFFNVPARRKFLRSVIAEAAQVAQVLTQFALAYPEVAFQLTSNGRRTLVTSGSGDPVDVAVAVLGREAAGALLPLATTVEVDRPARGVAARVSGHIAEPRISRSTRSGVWLFVNRRPVRSRTLSYAVEEGYHTLLQVGRHPVAVINLEVPPLDVDVNVHPAKTEVRLLRERLIYAGLRDAVRSLLAREAGWGKGIASVGALDAPGRDELSGEMIPGRLLDAPTTAGGGHWPESQVGGRRLPVLRLMGQVAQTYIVAEGDQGLYLIDQHAAHERVLLDRLLKSLDREGNTQLLLEPVSVELTPGQLEVAAAAAAMLEGVGYRLEPFGETSLLVRGVPVELPPGEAVNALQESLQELSDEGSAAADWRERLAVALSCRGAVKAGQLLAPEEMRSLLESLEEADITQHCSHGRPTAILLSHSQLEREFGRR